MGKKTAKSSNLGRSLIKDRFGHNSHKRTVDDSSMLHTTELQDGFDWGRLNLQSVTEESSFQDFLRTAELAGTEFQAEKLNIAFVNPKSNVGLLSKEEKDEIEQKQIDKKNLLKIPRRPKWSSTTTPEELKQNEQQSFLEWRRGLAMLQENDGLLMTPYEKNLEFWRQLWRVVEKSDILVQIVDARNPLQFRCEDIEKYAKEVNENMINVILINKADFLTEKQREIWIEYFDKENIKIVFFSAKQAAEDLKKIEEEKSSEESNSDSDDDDDDDEEKDESTSESIQKAANDLKSAVDKIETHLNAIEEKLGINSQKSKSLKILNREELIEFFQKLHTGPKIKEGVTTVGLVGYPNVGKSSTINAIMMNKKVSVSATPGKTKHFQTLFIDGLMLCDCPGLVMPSFVLTKADMILNGILPIDQMRDHVPPVNLLCTLIPRHVLEDKYGIMIAKPLEGEDPNRPPFAEELLLAYGYNRGFMTANGQPDQPRSSRYVLKDYVNGKLLYCYAPPGIPQEEFHKFPERVRQSIDIKNLPPREQRAIRAATSASNSKDIDSQFFQENCSQPRIKGRTHFPYIRTPGAIGISSTTSSNVNPDKPWKHQKREKREKLRKKFVHLDQH